ncbi:hypothetical protein C4J85_3008 [Pseudomonas sp. R4-34-07]|nr:hypothetical protein C4J85_3008 [Pseudomonas sp. R4-34-07]
MNTLGRDNSPTVRTQPTENNLMAWAVYSGRSHCDKPDIDKISTSCTS